MDYKEKYEMALEGIQEILGSGADSIKMSRLQLRLQGIFPELKESEDEQHRKWILEYLYNGLRKSDEQFKDQFKCAIAWLEKQGETSWKPSKEEMDVLYGLSYITNEFDERKEEVITRLYQDLKREFFNGASFENMFPTNTSAELEKQDEQKPIDEVKPKFKVGDWVVYNRNEYSREIMQIYDIRDGRYYFNDNVHFSWSIKECDEKSHLWTIQDVNDGDVLVDNYAIIIFRKIGNYVLDDVVDFYICYSFEKGIIIQRHNLHCGSIDSVFFKPATKEQRDLLFQKIKEAGYEWDAEKKELNRIEQKSAWSEEDERHIKRIVERLEDIRKSKEDNIDVASVILSEINWLKSLKERMKGE